MSVSNLIKLLNSNYLILSKVQTNTVYDILPNNLNNWLQGRVFQNNCLPFFFHAQNLNF